MSDKFLFVSPKLCIGCRTCELACSFRHSKKQGEPGITRVHTYTYSDDLSLVTLCQQCDDAACVKVCPTNALYLNEKTGVVDYDAEKCVKCGMCSIACPFGNISYEPETKLVQKCDLCQGNPACAMFCPTKALEYAATPSPPLSDEERKRVIPPLPWMIAEKISKKK